MQMTPINGIVTYASFRQASQKEMESAQGSLIYRIASLPWKALNKTWGTFGIQ